MGASRRRVQCRACGRLVLSGLSVCPYCGRNPARLHSRWRPTLLSVLLGVGFGFGLLTFAPGVAAPLAALVPTPTVRAALAVPARPTFTPTTTSTPRPTTTPTYTATEKPSATATDTLVPSETSLPTDTATNTAVPTETPVPTDTPSVTPLPTEIPSATTTGAIAGGIRNYPD